MDNLLSCFLAIDEAQLHFSLRIGIVQYPASSPEVSGCDCCQWGNSFALGLTPNWTRASE